MSRVFKPRLELARPQPAAMVRRPDWPGVGEDRDGGAIGQPDRRLPSLVSIPNRNGTLGVHRSALEVEARPRYKPMSGRTLGRETSYFSERRGSCLTRQSRAVDFPQ